jgi:hypothetical protein
MKEKEIKKFENSIDIRFFFKKKKTKQTNQLNTKLK